MKTLCVIFAVISLTVIVHASGFLFQEDFTYVAGTNLAGQGGWVAHSQSGVNPQLIYSPGLTYPDFSGSGVGNAVHMTPLGEDVNHQFTQITSGTVYASALINVSSASAAGDYFINLGDAGSFNFYARAFIAASGSGFVFGLSKYNGVRFSTTSVYNFNQTYLIVLKYNFVTGNSNDYCNLFINPLLGAGEPSPDLTSDAILTDIANISAIYLRQGGLAAPDITVDGIRVSTTWTDLTLPIEISSFTSYVNDRNVILNWSTQTEKNSDKFLIERKSTFDVWKSIGSVKAAVLSNSPKHYTYSDIKLQSGNYQYRLKMIDNDGTFEYSKTIEAEIASPDNYELDQNYPNPFNPNTVITYSIPSASEIKLMVYNTLGQSIKTLESGYKPAGNYSISFNASVLPSGIYFYKLEAGSFTQIKKMVLMK
jgi:hypothetical protein